MRPAGSISGAFKAVGDPLYVQGRNRSELLAHFPSGTTVQVELGRRRRYPGLDGPAPSTHLCYRKFFDVAASAPRIIDVGCGSGMGLRYLLQTKSKLIGIDNDGKAIAFARQYVPDAEFIHGDIQSSHVKCQGEAVLVVDVLGIVDDPVRLLRSLVRRVADLDVVFLAEPIANDSQVLVPPSRRAFGLSSIRSLLTRSNFQLEDWTTVEDSFLCVIARPARDPLADVLMEAEEAYLGHQTQRFDALSRSLRHSGRPEIRLEASLLESRFWFDMGDYGRAIAVLTDASTLVPEDPRPWSGLARLALISGNTDRAIRLADKAVKIDSSDLSSVCSSALALFEVDPRRSIEAWKSANALAPDEPRIAKFLCAIALSQGRHEEGLKLLDRVGQFQQGVNPLNDHVGLQALTCAALK